jgi:uncharacterized protein with von Willebrand factor type A (vWA) domain
MSYISNLFKTMDSKNNVIQDGFDKMTWEELSGESQQIKEQMTRGKKILKEYPALAQDIFSSLYKNEPCLTKDCPYGTELNRKQIEDFMKSSEFQTIRDYTTLDEWSAALATSSVMDEVNTRLEQDEDLKKAAEQQNQEGQNKQDQTEEQKQQQQRAMQNTLAQNASKLRRMMMAGIKKAQDKVEEDSQLISSLGWGDEHSELKKLPFPDRQKLMDQLKRVKSMAKYVGKMRALAKASSTEKIKSSRIELSGVTLGNDITKTLPQELIQLHHPILKYDFYRKFLEHQLLQYEMKKDENKGKGHIICLLDDSGSMNGEPAEKARGAMFGLLECARIDKRNFALDIFADRDSEFKREFPKGEASPQQTIELLTAGFGGGTDYDGPMEFAMELVDKSEYKGADIVIITDGACRLSDDMRERLLDLKKEKKTKVYAIMLDGYGTTEELSKWCDGIFTDIGDETMTDIMKSL